MERTTRHKIKRRIKWLWVKAIVSFKMGRGKAEYEKARRPVKNINESQGYAMDITVKSILNPNSELYYDTSTQECYIKVEDVKGTIYVFIEARNIKIINTVFGYDIPIDIPTENYLSSVFRREMNKRRSQFKKEVISKIEFSLQKVLKNVSKRLNDSNKN